LKAEFFSAFFVFLLTFSEKLFKIYIVYSAILANNRLTEVSNMKSKKFFWIIGIISLVAALSAACTAFFIMRDKQKKDDEELMEYLDSAIE